VVQRLCPYCQNKKTVSGTRTQITGSGSFYRKSDGTYQKRYFCRPCRKTFSEATFSACRYQKKRHLNLEIYQYLVSGLSQRRLAQTLQINRKTVVRKFLFLGQASRLSFLSLRSRQAPSLEVEFDDLETFEHSKLKPLSVVLAVESKSRRILGFKVASMPAKGLLVKKSLQKYGPRKDERKSKRHELFSEIQGLIHPRAFMKSDENPHYGPCVRRYFPQATHCRYKGRRGCVVGQGELKSGGFDPLFSLNHTFAMFRANINRLFRRTWNTTKKRERLELHISLYVLYHNQALI
jgi:transposase-like protein